MTVSAAQMFSSQPTREKAISSAFDDQFAQEILKSDKLRVTILIGAIISFCVALLLLSLFAFEQFQQTFHGRFPRFLFTFLAFFFITLSCLLVERWFIVRRVKERGKASNLLQYLSAFIETSIPSIGLIVGIQFLGPVYTLFTPAPFVYPLFIVLSALRLNSKLCVFTGAVAALEYSLISLYLISTSTDTSIEPILTATPHHLFKGFMLLATGAVTGLVTLQIRKRILSSFETIDEKNRISRTFGEYVSPAVMDKLLTLKPDLRSEKRNVCVMFLDIRNFTSFAETRAPEEVVTYLESLFEFMIEIVNRHHGVINKFLGDGFMAVFGAPLSEGSDCLNGLSAAREILTRVEKEVSRGKVLPTRVGIGLHAGEAVTGSIGSSLRREYTVIGDVVNLAARIEKLNKQFSSQLLISEMVWHQLGQNMTGVVPMGEVQVAGRHAPIQIYQVA
jgi:adenylate cyclase